jgi:hypothetical protein
LTLEFKNLLAYSASPKAWLVDLLSVMRPLIIILNNIYTYI